MTSAEGEDVAEVGVESTGIFDTDVEESFSSERKRLDHGFLLIASKDVMLTNWNGWRCHGL